MAVALVQQKETDTGAGAAVSSLTVTLTANPGVGNCLVLCGTSSAGLINTVSGGGATWDVHYVASNGVPGGIACEIWVGRNTSGAAGTSVIVVTYTAATVAALNLTEWSGVATTSPLDQANTNTGSGTSMTPGSITTAATDLVIAAYGVHSAITTPGAPWTALTGGAPASGTQDMAAVYQTAGTGTMNPAATCATTGLWASVIVSLIAASGGGGGGGGGAPAPVSTLIKFGSYAFLGTWYPTKDERNSVATVTQLPRGDGAVTLPPKRGPGRISIAGGFHQHEAGATDLQSTVDALIAALESGPANLQLDSNRYWRMAQKNQTILSYDPTMYGDLVTGEIEFDLPDPFQYAIAASSDTWGGFGSGANSHTLTSGTGTAYALPAIGLTFGAAAATNLSFANSTSGESFTLIGTPTGTQITIDCLNKTVTDQAGVDNMFLFDGQFPRLLVGANALVLTLNSGQAPTQVRTSWNARWW